MFDINYYSQLKNGSVCSVLPYQNYEGVCVLYKTIYFLIRPKPIMAQIN